MSEVANKRKLIQSAQDLVRMSNPGLSDFEKVSMALAQVFTDMTDVPCELVLRIKKSDLSEAKP